MSDLLSIGRSGVVAYQGALATVGENVTNADTVGYSRRSVVLSEQSSAAGPYTLSRTSSAFGGVQANQVIRVWDQYQAMSAWSANSDANRSSTRVQYLSSVETMIGNGTDGVSAKLTTIFNNATQLAANPTNIATRQTMLSSINDAATAIGQVGANLVKIATTVSQQANTLVDQTNSSLNTLAKINVALKTAPLGSASRADLEDQRDSLISGISANIGVDVTTDATTGAASLKLSNYSGPILLSSGGVIPALLGVTASANGQLSMTLQDGSGTASAATPTGGALAGLVDVSNNIAGNRQQIDAIAKQLVTELNDWNNSGKTPLNVKGGDLLDPTKLTAATITLTATDPNAIAAGSLSGTGTDNGNIAGLAAKRDSNGVEAQWQSMAAKQALLVSSAKTESAAAAAHKDSAYSTLDETTGVDLDTEAAQLLRYQQAYSASAKIIQASRETLQSILALFN